MTGKAIFSFAEDQAPATRLAHALSWPAHDVSVHRFPDGESLVTVPEAPRAAYLYRSLNDPNAKLIECLLAVSALRDQGAELVVLVAPYLGYMRQDAAFRRGQAVSQRVIGRLIADHFDGLITVDPHLHRIARLKDAVPGIPSRSASAAPVLAAALPTGSEAIVAGPDAESKPWVEAVAGPSGLPMLVGRKRRLGDRQVEVTFGDGARVRGRPVVLVDDVISSGETLAAAARALLAAGAVRIDVLATHCLAGDADLARLKAAEIASVRCTDTVLSPAGVLSAAPILARAILDMDQAWP